MKCSKCGKDMRPWTDTLFVCTCGYAKELKETTLPKRMRRG